ncbi:MAG: hypothetical protein HQL20_09560 [Candidatus Omnitrophica bacterium]|nr:hypothetical protein [Candidatus Omnitrophota bacterium]
MQTERILNRMYCRFVLAIFFSSFLAMNPALAAVSSDELLQRIEKLERSNVKLEEKNAALEKVVANLQDKLSARDEKALAVPVPPVVPQVASVPSIVPPLTTKPEIDIYGFVEIDSTWSDSSAGNVSGSSIATSGLAAFSAPHETTVKNVGSYNLSAESTRLGMNIKSPGLAAGGKLTGKIESDFSANSGPTYQPRLRLGYVQLEYAQWSVRVGQAWDFFAPVYPDILNGYGLCHVGDVGHRHPQAYIKNLWGEVLGGKLTTAFGMVDSDDPLQENSGVPVLGAYAGYARAILGVPATMGLGQIYGTNSTSWLNNSGPKKNDIYATVAGLTLKFTDWLAFKSEAYSGGKLEDFKGGTPYTGLSNSALTAGSVQANIKPLRAMGGFIQLSIAPIKKVETNFGMGLDNIRNDAETVGNTTVVWRTNRTSYANINYNLTKEFLLGLEYQYFKTEYLDGYHGDDNRLMSIARYRF